jgi:putative chitinase
VYFYTIKLYAYETLKANQLYFLIKNTLPKSQIFFYNPKSNTMKRSKLYLIASLLLATLIFIGCQLDEESQKNPHDKIENGKTIRTLNGANAQQVRDKLMNLLKGKGTLQILEESSLAARTDGGTIDFNSILEVIDTLGVKNYTFRVINHPQDDFKTFHNLILTEKDGTLEATMMEYKMTDQFATAYNNELKTFQEFAGRVGASSLTPISDPCQEVIVEIPDDPISPTPGDPAGGSTEPGEPSYGTPGSDPGAGGGMSSGCVDIVVSVECSCGRSYSSWDNYTSSQCGNGSYPGYSVTVVISYQYNMLCRAEDDPCNPEGLIGVMEPVKTAIDCLTVGKLGEIFPNASLEKKTKFLDLLKSYAPLFGIDTKEEIAHFIAQVGGETGGVNLLSKEENLNYTSPQRIIQVFGRKFSYTNPNLENPNSYINNPQALANYVYCCVNGNNDKFSGDGWTYRGRGVFQLTFKNNYNAYANFIQNSNLNVTYSGPDDLTNPNGVHGILSGMWYFKTNILDKTNIDNLSSDKVSRYVNPGAEKNALTTKRNYFNLTLSKLNC